MAKDSAVLVGSMAWPKERIAKICITQKDIVNDICFGLDLCNAVNFIRIELLIFLSRMNSCKPQLLLATFEREHLEVKRVGYATPN